MRSEAVENRSVWGGGADPRVAELQGSAARLRSELDAFPAELRDRVAAEEQLDALAAMAGAGVPDVQELRYALLQVAGAVGSVSVLGRAMAEVRHAVELFGEPVSGSAHEAAVSEPSLPESSSPEPTPSEAAPYEAASGAPVAEAVAGAAGEFEPADERG